MTPKDPPKAGTRARLIYDARTKAGLSQLALAKRLGTDRRNVIRWENYQGPGADYAEALAEEFGIPFEQIVDPKLANVRRNPDRRVNALRREMASIRAELVECRRENRELRRELIRKAS